MHEFAHVLETDMRADHKEEFSCIFRALISLLQTQGIDLSYAVAKAELRGLKAYVVAFI